MLPRRTGAVMSFKMIRMLSAVSALLCAAVLFGVHGRAAGAEVSYELSPQDTEALGWMEEFSREIKRAFDAWITSGEVAEAKFFARLYYPIPKTSPTKYTTDYDRLADRDLPAIQEKYFAKASTVLYAVAADANGYVPTHNRQFSQPMTGNRAVDLVANRSKRIFGDLTGFNAGRSQTRYLLQRYSRDTGEVAVDLSMPIFVRGKHWGCVRLGYRPVDRR